MPTEKKAVEMTEYGKRMESHEAGFPTLPTLFGNPFGIPTFPRPRRLDIYMSSSAPSTGSVVTARGL
jgi:hypothetical protein